MEYLELKMKILLINPRCNYDFIRDSATIMLPNNLLILAGYGRPKGHNFRILDMNLDDEISLLSTLRNWVPDIVGITVMTGPVIKNAVEVSKTIKRILPKAKVIWGGVHPTMLPEQVLKEQFVDIVVIRDGEKTLVDIAETLSADADISHVLGIAYRAGNDVRFSPARPLLCNLDELLEPAWDLVDIKRYMKYSRISLNTSRGCPFRCTFCYNKIMNDNRRAELSAGAVFNQVLNLHKTYGAEFVNFLEDNFTANWQRVENFCHLMINSGLTIKWSFEGRSANFDRGHLRLLKEAGCEHIRFGVESGSPKILNFIKKDITVEEIRRVFRECQEVGIKTTMYLMMGIPNETDKDRKESLLLLDEFPDSYAELVIYRPYPGTELFDYCLREGLFIPPDTTIEWVRVSDQYDPRFSVDKASRRDIWKCQLHVTIQNRKRFILPSRFSLPAVFTRMTEALILRIELSSLILHIPRHILVKPAKFLVSSLRNIYHGFRKLYRMNLFFPFRKVL